jgi:SAM-dependent methyltransferase
MRKKALVANAARNCRCCGQVLPEPFLDLGTTPLANAYPQPGSDPAAEERYPLAVAFCPRCHLVQLADHVAPEKLFSEYLYFSSYSDSFLAHSRVMAEELSERFALGASSLVVEVASNDGYLLQYFQQRGIPVLGVEPARNIAAVANERGIPTLVRFFGPDMVDEIRATHGRADVVIGNNVLAHVPGINGFLAAVTSCLKPTGAAVFEFPYLQELLDNTEFDTIYHEHVFYYSLLAIDTLARRAGLELFDVTRQAVHGGTLRIFLQHAGARPVGEAVTRMLQDERANGLADAANYARFGLKVGNLKERLLAMLHEYRAAGKRVAAYGAPAKGNTLLNYCGIGTDLIEFTVDRSPHKQGLLLPGSRIPILAPQALLERQPDYSVILPWNLAAEIVDQQREYLRRGGRFIVPVPEPRVLAAQGETEGLRIR